MRYSLQFLISYGFIVLGHRKLLSLSFLVVGAGGIGPTLLLFLSASGVGSIMVVVHNDMEVSKLHWRVIHTKGMGLMSKATSARDAMRALNPNVSVTSVMEPITWDKAMELVRGNDCMVDTSNNPHTRYLINDACVLVER